MSRRDPFDDSAWLFEPKYDGYRGLLYVTRRAEVGSIDRHLSKGQCASTLSETQF